MIIELTYDEKLVSVSSLGQIKAYSIFYCWIYCIVRRKKNIHRV